MKTLAADTAAREVVAALRSRGLAPQTTCTPQGSHFTSSMMPRASGECRLLDGTVILASGDPVALDVQGVRLLQNYAAVNHLTGDAWTLPQIKTAVKYGMGISRDEDLLLVR